MGIYVVKFFKVGRGLLVGEDLIASWQDPDPFGVPTYAALTTGWGSTGEWELTNIPGVMMCYVPFLCMYRKRICFEHTESSFHL